MSKRKQLGPNDGQLYWQLLDEALATYVDWDELARRRIRR